MPMNGILDKLIFYFFNKLFFDQKISNKNALNQNVKCEL